MTTITEATARTRFMVSAIDRTEPQSDFLPLGKPIQVDLTTHLNSGIISSSSTALSIEETIELIEKLSKALERATSLGL